MSIKIRPVLLFAAFLLIASLFLIPKKKPATPSECIKKISCSDCNLILISIDSLRADHVSAYGYDRPTTPFFDEISKKGVLFSNYFTASYLTPITEASVHTGMYPTGSGVTNFDTELPSDKKTIGEILNKEGFKTAALHTSPEFWFFPALKNVFSRGFQDYRYIVPDGHKRDLPDMNIVRDELNSFGKNQFFFWLSVGRIHWPYYGYQGTNVFTNPAYNGILKNRELDWDNTFGNIYNDTLYPEKTELTADDKEFIVDKYDEGIRQTDNFLGSLFLELRTRGLLKNTIIVIASEHGEDLGEHGYYAHYDILDDQIHTPFLILSPKLESGQKIDGLTSSTDVLPTVLALLGRSAPSQIQGADQTPVICGAKVEDRNIFTERNPLWEEVPVDAALKKLRDKGVEFGTERFKDIAIRTKEWKYIIRYSGPILQKISWWGNLTGIKMVLPEAELYDLANDPGETINVVTRYPGIAKYFRESLLSWYSNISKNTPAKEINKKSQIQTYF